MTKIALSFDKELQKVAAKGFPAASVSHAISSGKLTKKVIAYAAQSPIGAKDKKREQSVAPAFMSQYSEIRDWDNPGAIVQ